MCTHVHTQHTHTRKVLFRPKRSLYSIAYYNVIGNARKWWMNEKLKLKCLSLYSGLFATILKAEIQVSMHSTHVHTAAT